MLSPRRQEGLRLVHARTWRHDGPHGLPAAHEYLHGLLLLLIHRRESRLGAQNALSYIQNERRQPSATMDSGEGLLTTLRFLLSGSSVTVICFL